MAKTKWWHCGSCGFQNHPRTVDPKAERCEQCGHSRTTDDGKEADPINDADFKPGA